VAREKVGAEIRNELSRLSPGIRQPRKLQRKSKSRHSRYLITSALSLSSSSDLPSSSNSSLNLKPTDMDAAEMFFHASKRCKSMDKFDSTKHNSSPLKKSRERRLL
jgi:hypothetical protein